MNIYKRGEAIPFDKISIMIFANPGVGKTATASTSKNAIIIDFNDGAKRVNSKFISDVFIPKSWSEIDNAFYSALESYDTIIIDTVDDALLMLGSFIKQKNPKLAVGDTRQFYGKLKQDFELFYSRIDKLGKDIIYVCHEKEVDEAGRDAIKKPIIIGGTYNLLTSRCDFIGYLYIEDKQRLLEFSNVSGFHIGKDSANFGQLTIPDFSKEPKYFSKIIDKMKSAMTTVKETEDKAIDQIVEARSAIDNFTTAEEFNEFLIKAKKSNYREALAKQIFVYALSKAEELSFVYDKASKKFKDLVQEKEQEKEEEFNYGEG